MSTFFGTSINESPTVVLPASEDIASDARGIALTIKDGGLALPSAGEMAFGISLMTGEEEVLTGDDVTVQIKDIGKWVAGEEIAVGDLLTTDAEGKAVVAASGDFVMAVALSEALEAGTLVKMQIIKAGYAQTSSSESDDSTDDGTTEDNTTEGETTEDETTE